MSTDTAILRQYLVALGFKVDKPGLKNFSGALGGLDKTALKLGSTILGVATAAQAMVGVFAIQMEKLYYSSKRANTSVGNMQALEFGARNVGISGEAARASLEKMSMALRTNPGLTGLLNNLGVAVKGRDTSDVLKDMVGQLKQMPFYVANQYASMFGMTAEELFMWEEGLDKIREAEKLRKQMASEAGLNTEEASKAAVEYGNAVRRLAERIGILKDVIALDMLGGFLKVTTAIDNNLGALTRWLTKFSSVSDAFASLFTTKGSERTGPAKSAFEWITTHRTGPGAPAAADDPAKPKLGMMDRAVNAARAAIPDSWRTGNQRRAAPAGASGAPAGAGGTEGAAELFARLERDYALPPGALDRFWKTESSRGRNMLGPMTKYGQAKGHFQFMDATAKEYGVSNPNDLAQSATGAAHMLSDLRRKYDGDMQLASAAYNWGQGNLDRALGKARRLNPGLGAEDLKRVALGSAPAETQGYVGKTAGGVEQTNHITVTGVKDPDKAAAAVSEAIKTNNADLVRNMTPRVN